MSDHLFRKRRVWRALAVVALVFTASANAQAAPQQNGASKDQATIARHLEDEFNGGANGLPAGGLHFDMPTQPVVVLSYDGDSATGHWC